MAKTDHVRRREWRPLGSVDARRRIDRIQRQGRPMRQFRDFRPPEDRVDAETGRIAKANALSAAEPDCLFDRRRPGELRQGLQIGARLDLEAEADEARLLSLLDD